jgi:hypothetical protein
MRNWMSNISDALLSRLGRGDAPFPAQGFTGSASDLAAAHPPVSSPPRSTGMFIPTTQRTSTDDAPAIKHLRLGR